MPFSQDSFFGDTIKEGYHSTILIIQTFANTVLRTPKVLLVLTSTLGFILVFRKIYSFLSMLFSVYIATGKNLRSYGQKGCWVLITGASDGIGKEFALQLANQGFNLLLVSRTQSKLDVLALEIESSTKFYKPEVRTIALDFAKATDADYKKLAETVDGLEVAILVNNVGLSHSFPEPFALTDTDVIKNIIEINCHATLRVTSLCLPGMLKRKRGLVLTLGSFGGLLPNPLLATYSGSKAFLQHWSSAVASELDGSGVDVQFVVPYLITSAMSKISRPSFFIPTTRAFVKSVLKKVGRSGGSTVYPWSSTPYPSHALMQWTIENTLGLGSETIITYIRNMHQQIRARALRKAARNAKIM